MTTKLYGQVDYQIENELEYTQLLEIVKDAINEDYGMDGVQIIETPPYAIAVKIEIGPTLLSILDVGRTFGFVACRVEDGGPGCTSFTSIWNEHGERLESLL